MPVAIALTCKDAFSETSGERREDGGTDGQSPESPSVYVPVVCVCVSPRVSRTVCV